MKIHSLGATIGMLASSLLMVTAPSTTIHAQEVSPTSIAIKNDSATCAGGTQSQLTCLKLPEETTVNKVDIFFLFDDTGSFAGSVPEVTAIFGTLVTELQTALPGIDFGFGVGRFEDYGGPGNDYSGEDQEGRPFTLNQPIINTATAGGATELTDLINTALNNEAPGYGGDGPETAISEGLYQIALGTGFDGDGDGSTNGLDGTQVAGALSTQVSSDISGDVPAFSSLDPAVKKAGSIGGAGFRPGALKLVILATDVCSVAAFDSASGVPATVSGISGVSVPTADLLCNTSEGFSRFGFVGDAKKRLNNTIANAVVPLGAGTVPQTIAALNAAGIRVIGMGTGSSPQPVGSGPSFSPAVFLSALARLTGAVDSLGEPLVYNISGGAEPLKEGVVTAVTNAVTLPIDVILTSGAGVPSALSITVNPELREDVPPAGEACFDVGFKGDSSVFEGSFSLNFLEAGTSSILGSVPVTVDCSLKEVVCAQSDVSGDLFVMDGNANSIRKLVGHAAKALKKAGGSKSAVNGANQQAQTLYQTSWTATWKVPSKPLVCGATPLCSSISTSSILAEYSANMSALKALLDSTLAKLKKAQGGKLTSGQKKLKLQAASLLNSATSATKKLPTAVSSCGGGVKITISNS
jgi:hypothetical protein